MGTTDAMTKFIRFATALATATAVAVAPLSAAHASSLGGSSSSGGAVIEQPTQPTELEVSAEIREWLINDLKKSGFFENAAAQAKADEWAARAAAGEITYTAQELGIESFNKVELDGGIYSVEVVRLSRDLGYLMINNPEFWTFEMESGVVAPVGVSVVYAEDSFHVVMVVKVS